MTEAAAYSTNVNQSKSPTISLINSIKGKTLRIADEYVFKLNKTTTILRVCETMSTFSLLQV